MSRLSDNIKYYVLVGITGLLSASLAIGLYLVYTELWQVTLASLSYTELAIIPLSFAAIGLSYYLVKRFAKTKTTGSGTHTVLEAYHLTNGEVSLRDTAVKPIAAMLTIGLGGSAGPEGPSLLAGGGMASAMARHFKVKPDLRRRLFVAGAAAGLAATFRTPLTGILFALEIPYKNDLDRETFIEAIIASIPSYLLSVAILGPESIFGAIASVPLTLDVIGLSLLLGVVCGLYAVLFTKTFSFMDKVGLRIKEKYGSAALVTLVLYSLGFQGSFQSTLLEWVYISWMH
jgi:CIC family chloride channel protein